MFYHYDQNNSGGRFVGLYHHIIIEAPTREVANNIAENSTDIYFDGCEKGFDCNCCGDRWSRSWDDGGTVFPQVFGTPVEEYNDTIFGGKALVVYLDGTRKEYGGAWK